MCLSLMKASNPHTEIKIGVQLKQFCQKIHVESRVNYTTLDPGLSPIVMKERPLQSHYKNSARRVLPCFIWPALFRKYSRRIGGEENEPGFVIAEMLVGARKTEANEDNVNYKYLFRCLTTFVMIPSRSSHGDVKFYFYWRHFMYADTQTCRHVIQRKNVFSFNRCRAAILVRLENNHL